MTRFELVCLTIVAVYVALRLWKAGGDPRPVVLRFVLLSVSSAIAEHTIIRAYGTYGYATTWSIFVGKVPLVVVLVWPVVVDSAAVLARAILGGDEHVARSRFRFAAITAGIVLADAALIEPVAVRAGLWRWTSPGVFAVPIIGILGWAVFALVATYVIETRARVAVIAIGPLVTHGVLVAAWWAGLRFVEVPMPTFACVGVAWVASAAFVMRAAARPVPMSALLMRAPGAVFFFVLLATNFVAPARFAEPWSATWIAPPASAALLALHVAAFAAPYLTSIAVSGARRVHSRSS